MAEIAVGCGWLHSPNNCVQATPDCALLFIDAQVSGAPDAER
jgi:hypothetical protein